MRIAKLPVGPFTLTSAPPHAFGGREAICNGTLLKADAENTSYDRFSMHAVASVYDGRDQTREVSERGSALTRNLADRA